MNKVDVKFATIRKQYLRWLFRPKFEREKQFRNGTIAIAKEKCRINLNKPYIGTNILDLRQVLMQDFHYDYI